MRSSKLLLLAASIALTATACASSGSGSSSSGGTTASDSSASGGSATMITADQITAANVPTAYEAVDRLHRDWWQDLNHPQNAVVVYQDNNQKLGDGTKEALRQIPADDVKSIEYLSSNDAVMRFGQDALGGAIILTRK